MTKTYMFLNTALKAHEKQYIREALVMQSWNVLRAARALGISESSLYRKITLYKIKK